MSLHATMAANLTLVAEHHERQAANARKLAAINARRAQEAERN